MLIATPATLCEAVEAFAPAWSGIFLADDDETPAFGPYRGALWNDETNGFSSPRFLARGGARNLATEPAPVRRTGAPPAARGDTIDLHLENIAVRSMVRRHHRKHPTEET